MTPKVKVCGITRLQDAQVALKAGADAVGFVFAESPRRIKPDKAAAIIQQLGPWATSIGVFVNEKPEVVQRVAELCRLSAVQLHGDETPAQMQAFKKLRVIKAFRVGSGFKASETAAYKVDAYLFDNKSDVYGGSGKKFDWTALDTRKLKKPVIISGGLNAQNVGVAVRRFKPYAVDVSSGVESAPGIKDAKLIRKFIENVKKA